MFLNVLFRAAVLVALVAATTFSIIAQDVGSTLGTLGSGVPGAIGPGAARWQRPTGPPPRLATGKPDFSGVWEHAYVPDMALSSTADPALQRGAGPLPYTP